MAHDAVVAVRGDSWHVLARAFRRPGFRAVVVGVAVLGAAPAALFAAPGSQPASRGTVGWEATDLGRLAGETTVAIAINSAGQIVANAGDDPTTPESSDRVRALVWQSGKLVPVGGWNSAAKAMNDRGQVVGWNTKRGAHHAFLWQAGRERDLGTLGGRESEAVAINDRGQVVGWATTKKGARHAFLWQSARMRDLGTLGGKESAATAINARGQVVGWSDTNVVSAAQFVKPRSAFLWANGRMRELRVFVGTPNPDMELQAQAISINNRGEIMGRAWWQSGGNSQEYDGFLWKAGKVTQLPNCVQQAWPRAMNERGEIVGSSYCGSDFSYEHAVMWQDGKVHDLTPGAPSGDTSEAAALNERGQIVGSTYDEGSGDGGAFVFEGGRTTELPELAGAGETAALAINERNQIVGTSAGRAVLWTRP